MPLTKLQKKAVIEEIELKLKAQKGTIFVDFKGLKTKDIEAIKRQFKGSAIAMKVYKKNLIAKALEKVGLAVDVKAFTGSVAVITSEADAIAPSKESFGASKQFKEFEVLGGIFEQRYIDKDEVRALASIPSRQELLGSLAYVLNGPAKGFATALNEIMAGFVRVLQAKSEKAH